MQYFLGLPTFKKEKVFAPCLFVEIRKRLGTSYWQDINTVIIEHNTKKTEEDTDSYRDKNNAKENEGTINMDASVFEQDIIATLCVKTNQDSRTWII